MEIFRRPNLAPVFKHAFLPLLDAPAPTPVAGEVATKEESDPASDDDRVEVPSAFPIVQPMKAALYFDSAEGFGEWRILISTRADRNLREARNKDITSFKIYLKKIK